MATTFRSKGKGKDRRVYPIGKKKPYGISRPLAAEDIRKLRDEGKRARLIETNKRLDLYAPYVSALQDQPMISAPVPAPVPVKQPEPMAGPQVIELPAPENTNFQISKDKADAILTSIGVLNDKGNLNELRKNYNQWFRDGLLKITVQDGRAELFAVDQSRVAAIQERFFVNIPNGVYTIDSSRDGSLRIVPSYLVSKTPDMKFPKMEYDRNAAVLSIPNGKLKEFISIFNEAAKDSEIIKFRSRKGADGMDLIKRTKNEDGEKVESVVYHYDGTGIPDDINCVLSREYIASTIDIMFGRSRVKKPQGITDFTMKVKSDYPLEIQFTGQDKKGDMTGYTGLVAPRVE